MAVKKGEIIIREFLQEKKKLRQHLRTRTGKRRERGEDRKVLIAFSRVLKKGMKHHYPAATSDPNQGEGRPIRGI